jgi:hypothetical protein
MAGGDQVTYSVSRTINIGNYESVKVECGGSLSTDGKDRDEVWSELVEDVENQFNSKVDEVMTQLGVKKKTSKKTSKRRSS